MHPAHHPVTIWNEPLLLGMQTDSPVNLGDILSVMSGDSQTFIRFHLVRCDIAFWFNKPESMQRVISSKAVYSYAVQRL